MTITSILEYDKRKVLVKLDEHLEFPLYKGEVTKYGLSEGKEISEEIYIELLENVLLKRVKLRAMNLLQKRSYTREGLRRKLIEGRYPAELVEKALDYVSSYHYIDDVRYAGEYIRCYCESRSKRRIMQDLMTKGVSLEVAETVWQTYEAEFSPIDEVSQIRTLLQKKHFDKNTADYKETMRIMNFLYRKGYSVDCIKQCMNFEEFS